MICVINFFISSLKEREVKTSFLYSCSGLQFWQLCWWVCFMASSLQLFVDKRLMNDTTMFLPSKNWQRSSVLLLIYALMVLLYYYTCGKSKAHETKQADEWYLNPEYRFQWHWRPRFGSISLLFICVEIGDDFFTWYFGYYGYQVNILSRSTW